MNCKNLDEYIEHLRCMLVVLKQELYAHFKSILFARKKLFFLVILSEQNDIEVNKENIKAMTTPKSITEDR